jgi:beta-lactamase class A
MGVYHAALIISRDCRYSLTKGLTVLASSAASSIDIPDWSPLAARLGTVPDRIVLSMAARHLESGSTLEYDVERSMSSASTIKTLILAAAAKALDAGDLALDQSFVVRDDMRVGGSGVLNWLHDGVSLPLRDMAWLMIAISDNTASNAMIDAVGLDRIQQVAIELGTPSLQLARPFLGRAPSDNKNRNQVTARGLTDLLTSIWTDEAASPERCAWMRDLHDDQQHRDRLPRHLSDDVTYAGKTGSLDGIAHDIGVIAGPQGRVAISVLVEHTVDPYDADAFIGSLGLAVGAIVAPQDAQAS